MIDLPIPEELPDRSVVLDRDAVVWQRLDDRAPSDYPERRWFCVLAKVPGFVFPTKGPRAWSGLLVNGSPLCPMIAESALEAEGWHRAGYATPEAEKFRNDRTKITAGEVVEVSRAEADPAMLARLAEQGRQERDRQERDRQGYV